MLTTGVGLITEKETATGRFTIMLFVAGWALALWAKAHFPGIAPAEFVGVLTVVLWHYVLMLKLLISPRPRG